VKKKRVLFLCSENACRSQMAEAIVNACLARSWRAFSAGMQPAAFVHPMVAKALGEAGIPFSGKPKSARTFEGRSFDLIVTLCDPAEGECPLWIGPGRRIHHTYPDPGRTRGTEAEKLAAFHKLRDDMLAELPYLLERNGDGKME
jgi:arsenate reductase